MFCSRTCPRATMRSFSSLMVTSHNCCRRPRWIGFGDRIDRARRDRPQEVGVVVDPDDIATAVLGEPYVGRRAGDALDHRAVHAAVHDAHGLLQFGV